MSERLRPPERIRRRADYLRIQKKGTRSQGRFLTLIALPNGTGTPRLGVSASRRLGGAVQRNRAKRLIREVFRRNKPAAGFDLVVIPKPELFEASLAAIAEDFRTALRRHAGTTRS
jgi:ribonuclease P protein component